MNFLMRETGRVNTVRNATCRGDGIKVEPADHRPMKIASAHLIHLIGRHHWHRINESVGVQVWVESVICADLDKPDESGLRIN